MKYTHFIVFIILLMFSVSPPLLAIIEDGPPSEESPSREKPADDPYGERPADWPSDAPWPPRDDDEYGFKGETELSEWLAAETDLAEANKSMYDLKKDLKKYQTEYETLHL